MAEHLFYGKRRLCSTEVTDFRDFQGIGSNPMYKRYDSVYAVIDKVIKDEYKQFLAQPYYSDDDLIYWYVNEWNETPVKFADLPEEQKLHYQAIKDETLQYYKDVLSSLKGEDHQILAGAIKYILDDFIFCFDDKVVVVAWGMTPDTNQHKVVGAIIKDVQFETNYKIRFDAGTEGSLPSKMDAVIQRSSGTTLRSIDVPEVVAKDGWKWIGWEPEPVGSVVDKHTTFRAIYEKLDQGDDQNDIIEEPTLVTCRFIGGENGSLDGITEIEVPSGSSIASSDIPKVMVNKGFSFTGWDKAVDAPITEDTTFTALYAPIKLTRMQRLKRWFKENGCLKKMLWILLFLLLLLLAAFLLQKCVKDRDKDDDREDEDSEWVSDIEPIDRIEHEDGTFTDDNGKIVDIIDEDGNLPEDLEEHSIVAPIIDDKGKLPPIIKDDGVPDIIANRLNIFFDDEDVDLNQFAKDFKRVYPGKDYMIIGADDQVKFIQIQIPESRRDEVRESINGELPQYDFFVVDESILMLSESKIPLTTQSRGRGWHLDAIHLKEGWRITQGDEDIVVAIVDDGIDAKHDMFKGRIYRPYNVFTQNNHLSVGEGHGTHVAGLAVGSDKFYDEGAAGVAPKCKLMPVQVFDNDMCTISSLTSGIMYAIHQGADVINVSIAPYFDGMNILSPLEQELIAETQYKNEEKVYRKIFDIARKNNVVIVFAAGNNDVLAKIAPENRTNITINVAAVNEQMEVTDFSNYGSGTNISAPGDNIYSSVPNNSFESWPGTSMAAPIVAGTVALIKSVNNDLTVSEILTILQQSGCTVSGNIPPMVQVDRALQMAKTGHFTVPDDEAEDEEESSGETSYKSDEDIQRDYDEIRRKIREHQRIIKELEKQLPENQRL